jgi:biotin operon repressor
MSKRVPSRLPVGRFEALLLSGELHRIAKTVTSQANLARAIGMTPDAIVCARQRLRKQGVHVPSFEELQREPGVLSDEQAQRLEAAYRDSDNDIGTAIRPVRQADVPLTAANGNDDFQDEERTQPGVQTYSEAAGSCDVPLPTIPDGHRVHKVSTLIDAVTGEQRLQWVKTSAHSDPIADLAEAFRAIKDELPQADGPVAPPSESLDARLLSTYLLGDCHVGMRAWRGDAGANFDLKIAERNLTELTHELVRLAPPSERALIVNIGDYFHSDNRSNTTTKGTTVDVDGRWSKVLEVGIRIMRRIIESALEKHQHVTVINEIGNHDAHTSIFLSLALAQYFEHEPRVTIDTSPRMFHYYRFGKVLLMTHHGHNVKPRDLVGVLASDRAEDWGQTLYRYIYTGHIHHERSCEFPGAFWRSLRSPASADAWHDSMGYRSGHELSLEIHDAERGLINRHIVGVPRDLGMAS